MSILQDTQIQPHKYLEANKVFVFYTKTGKNICRIIGPNQYTSRTGDNLPDCRIYAPVEIAHTGDCALVPKTDLTEIDTKREIAVLEQQLAGVNDNDLRQTLENTISFLERFVSQ